jgi:hypothetical protein
LFKERGNGILKTKIEIEHSDVHSVFEIILHVCRNFKIQSKMTYTWPFIFLSLSRHFMKCGAAKLVLWSQICTLSECIRSCISFPYVSKCHSSFDSTDNYKLLFTNNNTGKHIFNVMVIFPEGSEQMAYIGIN